MTGTWLLAGFLVWIVLAIAYLDGLRRVLKAREHAVAWDLSLLEDCAEAWRQSLEGLGRREWREAATSVGRALEVLAGDESLKEKVQISTEIGLLLREDEAESRGAEVGLALVRERASELDRVLEQLEGDVADYNLSAADATFACGRFPLSLLSLAVGLRAQPVFD